MTNKAKPKQTPTINVVHKLAEQQFGRKHYRQNSSYFKMYKIAAPIREKIQFEKERTIRVNGIGSSAFRQASLKQIMSQRIFKDQLKATVPGFKKRGDT